MTTPLYFDHHATTPVADEVFEAMVPYLRDHFGNAGSKFHAWGMRADAAVEHAREQVAALLGAEPREVVFTSGATESNNLAVLGAARAMASKGRHVVCSAIEHSAVLDACRHLADRGWEITHVPVDRDGYVDPAAVGAALRPDTTVVSVMTANNEIGTVQPIDAIGALCRDAGVWFHTDAAQAVGSIPIDVRSSPIDMLSLTAHKMYGPKGIGALYVRRGRPRIKLEPLLYGGGQERGYRPGTLPVPGCVALGAAAALARQRLDHGDIDRIRGLRDRLWASLQQIPGTQLNGGMRARLPHNLNVSIADVSARDLMSALRGIALSSGSACSTGSTKPSHVLVALGATDERAFSSLRFGLGRSHDEAQVDTVASRVKDAVEALRNRPASTL